MSWGQKSKGNRYVYLIITETVFTIGLILQWNLKEKFVTYKLYKA